MPISSLPDECFSDVLSYLDKKSLYKCLFVNRYFCKITIPLIWREPFISWGIEKINISLINTLLACLNEDEISSLIPCAINFNNNQSPLFEYGKFIKIFSHGSCLEHILTLLGLPQNDRVQDCRIQKLINVIYHMIMRQGSNLQEFLIDDMWGYIYTDLPKCSTFTSYKPGITNLRYLLILFNGVINGGYENTIEFLNMVSKSCNDIVDCELKLISSFSESFVDIIKSQPLEMLTLDSHRTCIQVVEDTKVIYALKFRSETLKDLTFRCLDFRNMDLSFMSKLDRLEQLALVKCRRYLFTKKLHLKELILCYGPDDEEYDYDEFKITRAIINPLLSEELHMLDFRDIVTPEAVKAVGESCPNLKFLQISINSEISILPICELLSLKTLNIDLQSYHGVFYHGVSSEILVKMLGDNLKFVECLLLNFDIDLPSFKYFTDNCKADLKKLIIYIKNSRKDYLIHVSNYQKVHNSLKSLEIIGNNAEIITNEELEIIEIIDLLKNQGVDVKFNNRKIDLNFELYNYI